jgi:acetyltransferase-like isoleucine patch superfamily enzyme
MIALDEYIDPETININNPVLFRGKDCFFWQKKMFAGCTGESCIYTKCIQDNKGVDGVHFLVLFNPHTFLKISPDGIKEIINRLRSIFKEKRPLARGQEPIFSLSGYPFFAIHPETYEKLKPDPVHSNSFSLFNKLTANVTMLPMDTPYQTLNRKNDFLSIENFIHQFQAFELLGNGVIIEDYHNFYLEGIIPIGSGTRIAPGVVIKGESKIGKNSVLYPHVYLENSVIGDNCTVLPGCIITQSTLENNVQVGPYTHLRMNALVKEGAKMGNFVEMKKSTLGKGSKACIYLISATQKLERK